MPQLYRASQPELLKCGGKALLLRINEKWDYPHLAGTKTGPGSEVESQSRARQGWDANPGVGGAESPLPNAWPGFQEGGAA